MEREAWNAADRELEENTHNSHLFGYIGALKFKLANIDVVSDRVDISCRQLSHT